MKSLAVQIVSAYNWGVVRLGRAKLVKMPLIWLIGALVVFLVFLANVAVGAADGARFVARTGELLLIIATSILFVVGTLLCEARAKSRHQSQKSREETL